MRIKRIDRRGYYVGEAEHSLIHIKISENQFFECAINKNWKIGNCGGVDMFESSWKLTFD